MELRRGSCVIDDESVDGDAGIDFSGADRQTEDRRLNVTESGSSRRLDDLE